ncbi:putative molybdenum carrier protein [Rubrivirga sp. IMCC45206]|uniref:putative molybdenum carrier protein n=1 Tax=Rubrivirga sp. IMCC45206 TaxID=3391614 RepID=UPI00398FC27D
MVGLGPVNGGRVRFVQQACRRSRRHGLATHSPQMPLVIVSGGQSGVDRAALDAALASGFEVAGWCPAGRWAEDGPIDARYPLRETASADPAERTRRNVAVSDALLVLAPGPVTGGTALAVAEAQRLGRPVFVSDPSSDPAAALAWLARESIQRLNVAGPRESEAPGVYGDALAWLGAALVTTRSTARLSEPPRSGSRPPGRRGSPG